MRTLSSTLLNPVGTGPWAIISNIANVGDFNGDGQPDVIVVGYTNQGLFNGLQFLGSGGRLLDPFVIPFASNVSGDFNGDGITDLAGGNQIMLGCGNGSFQTPVNFTSSSVVARATGDFNNDGKVDLVVENTSGTSTSIWLGNGDGTFTLSQTFSVPAVTTVVADFNGDGNADLAD